LVLTSVVRGPLADPTLFDKIAHAKAKGVWDVIFTTNGILLTKNENWRRCMDVGLHTLHISWSGLSDAAYQRIYRSKRYPSILDGIACVLLPPLPHLTAISTGSR
jgi:molybdenum cofactor biosynthesis enzyme MoaA